MRVGILLAGHLSGNLRRKHGSMADMFIRLFDGHGISFEVYPVVDGVFPATVTDCDAWLTTGSAHGVYDALPFMDELSAFLRRAFDFAVPQVGICFGHQILAHSFGATVRKSSAGWNAGAIEYTINVKTMCLNAMHQDQVETVPIGAEVIASSEHCKIAGLRYGDRAISFQPHPEFTSEFMKDLVQSDARLPKDTVSVALNSMRSELHEKILAREIVSFLKNGVRRK